MRLGGAAIWAAVAVALAPRPSRAHAGDPTPGSLAPVVAIVNPAGGPVGARLRVQARAQHPSGVAAIQSVVLSVVGASTFTAPLARNPRYALGPDAAVYEAVIDLGAGGSVLLATATDGAGRHTASAPVQVQSATSAGDGNLLVRDNSSQLCADCHALPDHGSETAGRGYGAWTTTCRDCHTPHGTANAFLVRESITPPDVAVTLPARPVRVARRVGFAADGGAGAAGNASFANADGSGPCQVCHTRTARWTSGGAADARHRGDCAFCHQHAKGFRSRCEDCHAAPPASGAHRAHYADTRYPLRSFYADPRVLADEPGAPSTLVGCGGCHPTDFGKHGNGVNEVELYPSTVLPGGTSTLGATAGGAPGARTCTVACHAPFVATPSLRSRDVPWDAPGPLPCTACHAEVNRPAADPAALYAPQGPSLHTPVFADARPAPPGEPTTCSGCHEPSSHDASHLTGRPALVSSAAVDAACLGCHGSGGSSAGVPVSVRTASITRSSGSFVTDGYKAGRNVTVGDLYGVNSGSFLVTAVTDSQLTLRSGYGLQAHDGWYQLASLGAISRYIWVTIAPDRFLRAAGSFGADGHVVGGAVTIAGAAHAANNGTFTVATVSDFTFSTVSGTSFTVSSAGTITRATGSFVTDGFVAGGTVTMVSDGYAPPLNRGIFTLAAVTPAQLTIAPGRALVDETSNRLKLVGHSGSMITPVPGNPALVTEASAGITLRAGPGLQGQTLHRGAVANTPPLLLGWTSTVSDTTNGDFHGGRRGTCYWIGSQLCPPGITPVGFGGTLKPPYVRGEGPIHCTVCHAGHGSGNPFLLASNVNGTPIPPGSISRNGAGAQRLCNACHEGPRHQYCMGCHAEGWVEADEDSWFEGDPVDPAPDGTGCFWCHGHEGLQNMPSAVVDGGHQWGDCSHCHSRWAPEPLESRRPVVQQGRWSQAPAWSYYDLGYKPRQPDPPIFLVPHGTVFEVTATSASIYWETDEAATTYVEWGVGTPGLVAGRTPFLVGSPDHGALNTLHRVDLTGLAPNTTYVWRLRSSDPYRNVTLGALQTFRTLDPAAPPAPALVHQPAQYHSGGSGNDPWVWWTGDPLRWGAVSAPDGHPVEYRLQLGKDPAFATTSVDLWTTATSYPLELDGPLASYVTWYWRVLARDTVTQRESIWSGVDSYSVSVGDPYNDY